MGTIILISNDLLYIIFYHTTIFFLVIRPLTVLLHELGHAIPAILMTKKKVTIYIGSYGDPKKSLKFSRELLDVWFKYNPFSWRLGLCVPSASEISINQKIVFTLTGPITSFVIAVVASYFTFTYNLHGSIKMVLIIFLASSIIDLLNLIPDENPIKLYNGTLTHNDGYSLKRLFYYKRFPKVYKRAIDMYNVQKYADAAKVFDRFLMHNLIDESIYRLAITSYLQVKNFKRAKELLDIFIPMGKMNSDDYSNAGLTYSQFELHDKAIEFYDKSLELNSTNKYSLNNKGYTLNLLSRYAEAITLFNKVIEVDNEFAYSYSSRGLSKIKLGKTEEGLKDIHYSFKLDKDNSNGYLNLGIYHFDRNEFDYALRLFKKAKKIDSSTHKIDEYILKAQEHIEKQKNSPNGKNES